VADPTDPTRRTLLGTAAAATGLLARGAPAAAPAALPRAKPEDLGIDPKQLRVAHDLLEKWTTGKDAPVPGAALLVGRNGKALAPRLFGRQGPEPDAEPLRKDAMFYLASVTKPVVYMAAMRLAERGQLNLSDRVSRYLPEFTGDGRDAALVLHLFTHTAGLPDELPDNAELRKRRAPLKAFVEGALKVELLFKPGTRHSYASCGTILVAEIIQRLAGVSVREFVTREIIDPLGLTSTGLGAQGFAPERLVRAVVPAYQTDRGADWNSPYWREFGSPAGGMFSTPEDVAVICALVLNGGTWNGARLLSPATVRAMTSNRLDDLPEPVRRTQPWGLGWRLNHAGTPDSWGDLLDRRVFGHTGSVGNVVWMDPHTKGFCIVLSNYLRARAPWRLVHLSNAVAAAFE
jgi:CubicO group peptidase (beta-lactamase class C family)